MNLSFIISYHNQAYMCFAISQTVFFSSETTCRLEPTKNRWTSQQSSSRWHSILPISVRMQYITIVLHIYVLSLHPSFSLLFLRE